VKKKIVNINNYKRGFHDHMVRRASLISKRKSITRDGILAYPKIPTYTTIAKTEFSQRLSTGSSDLDELMSGGIPRGHMVLIGGNTGTGKSTLAMQYLQDGIECGESCIYIALEEPVDQIIKTAAQHGWDFGTSRREGTLMFLTSELMDMYPDKLLYDIVRATQDHDVKRVVLDSVSTLENGSFDRTRIREFLMQLVAFFKTSVMRWLRSRAIWDGQSSL
jgi:circadian clock protein KaiC